MRVLLVDDHPLFRDGVRSLLQARGVEVVGEAGDGQEAFEAALRMNRTPMSAATAGRGTMRGAPPVTRRTAHTVATARGSPIRTSAPPMRKPVRP